MAKTGLLGELGKACLTDEIEQGDVLSTNEHTQTEAPTVETRPSAS